METEKIDDNTTPPDLTPFSGKTAEWEKYQDGLFDIYKKTIVDEKLTFLGLQISSRRFPESSGKHYTFWHLISEGKEEENRTPDLRRCERIGWIAWIIKNAESHHPDISWWESKRGSSKNFVIWCEKEKFAVILAKRSKFFVLLSAYYVVKDRRIEQFKREREEYRKSHSK